MFAVGSGAYDEPHFICSVLFLGLSLTLFILVFFPIMGYLLCLLDKLVRAQSGS